MKTWLIPWSCPSLVISSALYNIVNSLGFEVVIMLVLSKMIYIPWRCALGNSEEHFLVQRPYRHCCLQLFATVHLLLNYTNFLLLMMEDDSRSPSKKRNPLPWYNKTIVAWCDWDHGFRTPSGGKWHPQGANGTLGFALVAFAPSTMDPSTACNNCTLYTITVHQQHH